MDIIDVVTRFLQFAGMLLLVGGLTYQFAALRVFSFLVPKDGGTERIASDVPFGPHARQQFDVYAPDRRKSLSPILIFVHGGSWDSGNPKDYEFVARAFAARGYVTVLPGYRFVSDTPFPGFVEDVALAVKAVQSRAASFSGDPRRIFLVGHSAGGYNVLQAVLDKRVFAAAGVNPADIRAVAALAAPSDFLPLDSPKTIAAFGAFLPLEETQPVHFARPDAPPILLLHGADDTTVFPRNSASLARKLRELGGVVQYTEYPGISHVMIMLAVAKPFRERAPTLRDVLSFFERYK